MARALLTSQQIDEIMDEILKTRFDIIRPPNSIKITRIPVPPSVKAGKGFAYELNTVNGKIRWTKRKIIGQRFRALESRQPQQVDRRVANKQSVEEPVEEPVVEPVEVEPVVEPVEPVVEPVEEEPVRPRQRARPIFKQQVEETARARPLFKQPLVEEPERPRQRAKPMLQLKPSVEPATDESSKNTTRQNSLGISRNNSVSELVNNATRLARDKKRTHAPDKEDRKEITLSGSKYYIDYDNNSKAKRNSILLSGSGKLTEYEELLLHSLGIVGDVRKGVANFLPEFFDALPYCQSTTQLLTNKKCETAYFVLWSVLMKVRKDLQKTLDEQNKKGMSQSNVYQADEAVKAISSVKTTERGQISKDFEDLKKMDHEEHTHIEDILKRIEISLSKVQGNVDALKKGKR